jgi:hypothetical protein
MSGLILPLSAVDLTADSSPSLHEIHRLLALLQRQSGCTYCIELDGDALAVRLAVILHDGEPAEAATLSGPMSFGEAVDFLRCYCLHVDGGSHAVN